MTKTLVIAEKPSVAQDIVRALTPTAGKFEKYDEYFESEKYVVTSAVGHLVEIQAPEEFDVKRGKWSFAHLPVIPPYFDLKPVDKTKTRLNAVVKQAKRKDVTDIINACDAGREGELIFRLIEQYAGGSKPLAKPVRRLWLQSMTPQAIRDGFNALRSEAQMQGLADAARSRSEADWLVGINGTRAMTAFNSRDGGFFLTTVGCRPPPCPWWWSAKKKSASSSAATTGKCMAASMPKPATTPANGSTRTGKNHPLAPTVSPTPNSAPIVCGTPAKPKTSPAPPAASPPR